jgi:hypothetical protein
MRNLISTAALLIASTPHLALAQEGRPIFDIMQDGSVPAKTPGHFSRQSRNFLDVWNALHPPGTEEKRVIPKLPAPKKNEGGIGNVGGIPASPNMPIEETTGGSLAPDVETPEAIGGIGAIGAPEVLSPPDEDMPEQPAAAIKAAPAEDESQDEEDTGSAIGSVGGIGAVGAPENK